MARRTIAAPGSIAGVGLHSGVETTVRVVPAEPGFGLRFRRVDLPGHPEIPARSHAVEATERRTVLGTGAGSIQTVEHLLAAVQGLQIDDLLIEIDGPEPPILDGSFAPYVELLTAAGLRDLPGDPTIFRLTSPFEVREGDAHYLVAPAVGLRLTTTIEWDHPAIGRQTLQCDLDPEGFRTELAEARTFGFLAEVEPLQAQGLLKGAGRESAIVLDECRVVNGPLRKADEFVRHKAGDIMGDLALLGGRLEAHVIATRPSHQGNVALVRALERRAQPEGEVTGRCDSARIMEMLPHRYPFLLVDRILATEADRIVGLKNVTINEPFFVGHFPGHPIMPGVLIVEAMAQTGGLLLMETVEDPTSKVVYFMSLDDVKFRRPVVPGDQLRFEVRLLQHRGRTCRMRGEAFVDGHLVCEAVMMARVVDR